jgi:leucine-rich repeat protein SHOC2
MAIVKSIRLGRLRREVDLRQGKHAMLLLKLLSKFITKSTSLDLSRNHLTTLPESIGDLSNLTSLNLSCNQLTSLPETIGNLCSLTSLNLRANQITSLPESIGNLSNLISLDLGCNQLSTLPESIGNLINLSELDLGHNLLVSLPDNIRKLINLKYLDVQNNSQSEDLLKNISESTKLTKVKINRNQLNSLPRNIMNFTELSLIDIDDNPLKDLSLLQSLPKLKVVRFAGVELRRRYWSDFSQWKPEWLLDEDNTEIRRILIEQIGYENITSELGADSIDMWREYTLIKIDRVQRVFSDEGYPAGTEPMVLLKMTCPSTNHIHILRVPPEMTSAEAAITWVNHGIHPDRFAIQT